MLVTLTAAELLSTAGQSWGLVTVRPTQASHTDESRPGGASGPVPGVHVAPAAETFGVQLPTPSSPQPESWRCLEKYFGGVTAALVIADWSYDGHNGEAARALAHFQAAYQGQNFLAEPRTAADGLRYLELVHLDTNTDAPKTLASVASRGLVVGAEAPPPPRYVRCIDVRVELLPEPTLEGKSRPARHLSFILDSQPFAVEAQGLVPLTTPTDDTSPEAQTQPPPGPIIMRFRVPDLQEHTPDAWWVIEALTGIAAERILEGDKQGRDAAAEAAEMAAAAADPDAPPKKKRGRPRKLHLVTEDEDDGGEGAGLPPQPILTGRGAGNRVLADVVSLLRRVLVADGGTGLWVPLGAQGLPDLDAWRRQLVRTRFRSGAGAKPFLFLGRPDHEIMHTRALMTDLMGEHLFVSQAGPGLRGRPTLLSTIRGRSMLTSLDDEDDLRGVLNRHVRFACSGHPPKPEQPPRELLRDLMRFPDPGWRSLRGLTRIPTVRKDGSILSTAGYDPESELWYAPEFELAPLPEQPSPEDVAQARALIITPFQEIPFDGPGSLAAAMAALVEQIVRPMIQGPRPLYVFDAPQGGQGSGKCVHISSLALTSRGLLTLKELAPRGAADAPADTAFDVASEGLKVPTSSGQTSQVACWYKGGRKPVRRLRTRRGFELSGTFVHPVRVASERGAEWRRMEELQVGDYVALNIDMHPGADTDVIDVDCAWLLGALTADGYLHENTPTYTKNDADLRKRVMKLAPRYLDANAVEKPPSEPHRAWDVELQGGQRVRAAMDRLDLAQTLAAGKYIPRSVRQSSSRIWVAFLQGLMDGDGHVAKSNFEWLTASERLCREVQIMLAALGVWSARNSKLVKLKTWTEPRTYWRLMFAGADVDAFARNVGLTKADKLAALRAMVEDDRIRNTNVDVVPCGGALIRAVYQKAVRRPKERDAWKREMRDKNNPSRGRLQAWLAGEPDGYAKSKLLEMCAPHIRWDRIESIENDVAEVADLSVPDGASFVANSVQVHNTLLAKIQQAIIVGEGQRSTITALGRKEEEIEKRLTSLLRDGSLPYVILDNLTGKLKSEALTQLATAPEWQARLLSTNEAPIFPQNTTWVLTLNGAELNRDLSRRVVLCHLDAKVSQAWRRKNFRIRYPEQWARERRASIIRAWLIIVRAWIQAGRPQDTSVVFGSFEAWSDVVAAIVKFAGFGSITASLEAAMARDVESTDDQVLMLAWLRTAPGQYFSASQLADFAKRHGIFGERILRDYTPIQAGRAMRSILDGLLGQVYEGHQFTRLPTEHKGVTSYALIPGHPHTNPSNTPAGAPS